MMNGLVTNIDFFDQTLNGDEIKEQVLEIIKESDDVDYVRSVCSLSETYSYGQYSLDSNRNIVIDKTRERNRDRSMYMSGRFTQKVVSINNDLIKNNKEVLYEVSSRTEDENRLIEVVEKMTNTEYWNLYKKHIKKLSIEYFDIDKTDGKYEIYESIESELN